MQRFTVVVVCDGNICRSPLLELALQDRLPEAHFAVRSAGLTPLIGHPMDPQMQRVATAAGLHPTAFRASSFDPRLAGMADLVLTMTVAQRDAVVGRAPRLLRRTLSLSEALNNLAPEPVIGRPDDSQIDRSPIETMRQLVRVAVARRSTTRLTADDDVPDPYQGDDALFEAVGHRLLAAAGTLADRWIAITSTVASPGPVGVRIDHGSIEVGR